jgi:hypothetical protein
MSTTTVRGTPDRTAHARGERLRLAPTGLASVDPRARLYALPGWGILVIRSGEKTTIARTAAWLVSALLRGPASGLKIDELPLPPDLAMTAIGELRQRRMLEVHYQGRLRLSDRVRANLSAAGGHTIIPTNCCR